MYGKVVKCFCPGAGIHTFVLKWDMTIVPDVMPLQEYPPTVNIPPSNDKKLFLQTSTNQEITVGYIFSSHQLSTSRYDYSWIRTRNRQHQQY